MSKRYRFKGGKHYAFIKGEHRPLKPGEIVEMTDKVAYGVRDRFELVSDKAIASPPEDEESSLSESEALVSGNVADVSEAVGEIEDIELLEAAVTAENAKPKPRKGVLDAIDDRLAELAVEDGDD